MKQGREGELRRPSVPDRAFTIAFVFLLLAAAAVRIPPLFSDFWQDEIWSLNFALSLSSPFKIFTTASFDNNHPLNTFFLWLVGAANRWEPYRIPSLLAGFATAGLMGVAGRLWGRAAALASLMLGGFSSILVLYATEARGYAAAVFFSLAAFLLLERRLARPTPAPLLLFWLSVLLGQFSHGSFFFVYAGLLCWSSLRVLSARRPPREGLRELLVLQLVPLAVVLGYFLWFRTVTIGGGDPYLVSEVLRELATYSFGLPLRSPWPEFLGLAILGCALGEIVQLAREKRDLWVFFLVVLAAPFVLLALSRPAMLFPRYFLVAIPFLLLLLGRGFSRLWMSGMAGRGVAGAVLGLFLLGNGVNLAALYRDGRGHYLEALAFMSSNTAGPAITVSSDYDFRIRPLVDFYAARLPREKPVVYVTQAMLKGGAAAEWVICHNTDNDPQPGFGTSFDAGHGRFYALVKSYPFAWLSGVRWFVYRRIT